MNYTMTRKLTKKVTIKEDPVVEIEVDQADSE
jgi:hypothetical protein